MHADTYKRPLDELETDVLVTTLFEGEKPPQGITGFIDWRLHGYLSRMILNGTICGDFKEMVLLPLHRKLSARRLLVVGLGKREKFNLTRALAATHKVGRAVSRLGARDFALSIPPAQNESWEHETEQFAISALGQLEDLREARLQWLDQSVVEHEASS